MVRILNKDGQLLAEIEGDSLRNAMLANKYLKGAQLAGQDLTGANLDDANLSQANLTGAIFEGASFENTQLIEADMSQSKLDGAQFRGAQFEKANLENVSAVNAEFIDCNLSRVWARNGDFGNASFSGRKESHYKMNNSDFSGAKFDGASVLGADVSFTCFFGTDLSKTESLGLSCRSCIHDKYPRGYPFGFGYSETRYNPFFDSETKWPENMKFPKAGIPWLLIGKHAGIAFFYPVLALCGISYFMSAALQEYLLSSALFVTIALVCVAGSSFFFWKRMLDINEEIGRNPALHFGRHVGLRHEYQLGAPMTDGELTECLKYR